MSAHSSGSTTGSLYAEQALHQVLIVRTPARNWTQASNQTRLKTQTKHSKSILEQKTQLYGP